MPDFNTLFEEYMMMDKKTLAQLLAMRDLRDGKAKQEQPLDITPRPYYPQYPTYPYPVQPLNPWYGRDWTITCYVK